MQQVWRKRPVVRRTNFERAKRHRGERGQQGEIVGHSVLPTKRGLNERWPKIEGGAVIFEEAKGNKQVKRPDEVNFVVQNCSNSSRHENCTNAKIARTARAAGLLEGVSSNANGEMQGVANADIVE